VYAVGMSTLDASATAPLLAALDSTGALRWLNQIPSPFAAPNRYLQLKLDAAGKPHAVGPVVLASGNPAARYDSFSQHGLLLMRENYLGPSGAARARALTLNAQSDVYLAGSVAASGSGYDALLLRYEAELLFANGFED